MRYQLMAIYRGLAFEAGLGPTDEDVVLFTSGPPPEGLQFEPVAGQWRKQVSRSELDALWESRPVGRYRGQGCLVLDDLGDRLHIAFQGHDAYQAEQLGYWQVDRGVYEVVVPRHDVTELTELRDDHPQRRAEPAPPAGPVTAPAGPEMAPAGPVTAPAGPEITPPGLMTAQPGPVPAGMFSSMSTQSGSMPAAAPVPAPPGPMPAETVASLATQPQRPMTPERAGAGGSVPQEPAARDRAAQEPAAPEPHRPEPAGPPQGPTGPQPPGAGIPGTMPASPGTGAAPQEPWPASQETGTASQETGTAPPRAWIASQETRTGRQHAPGSPQPPVPDAAGPPGERTAPAPPAPSAPSPRASSSLPADMMAPAPPREPPANGTGRWHPWVPEPDQAGSWESGPVPSGTNGANGWNGWNHPSSGSSAGQSGTDGQASVPGTPSSRGQGDMAQRDRADTHSTFRDLAALAAIPDGSYAVDEDVDGALCLVRTDDGFEVYSSAGNAKHEVRFFEDEESAYFYLFGVLAAEALRSGRLVRRQD